MHSPKKLVPAVPFQTLRVSLSTAAIGLVLGLSGCASPEDPGDGTGGGNAANYPDPVEKQMRMQEEMSRVTRSFLR
jgi:hypothetical protein